MDLKGGVGEQQELNSSGYNLEADIGQGTFGQVKLATHIDTGCSVAIKLLSKSEIQRNGDTDRVLRETQILARTNHPNIIYLYEIIDEEDYLFFVTEHCSEGDLESLLKKRRRLGERDACWYLRQIISAAQYLHGMNIAHRDIKPENILLSGSDIKLIDFGLGNTYNPRKRLRTPCGSPCFAPPEVCSLLNR